MKDQYFAVKLPSLRSRADMTTNTSFLRAQCLENKDKPAKKKIQGDVFLSNRKRHEKFQALLQRKKRKTLKIVP